MTVNTFIVSARTLSTDADLLVKFERIRGNTEPQVNGFDFLESDQDVANMTLLFLHLSLSIRCIRIF